METYHVVRDGKLQLRMERATVDSRGAITQTVRHPSQPYDDEPVTGPVTRKPRYVVDGKLAEQDGVLGVVTALASADRWAEIDIKYLAGPGESKSGLLVLTQSEWDAYRMPAEHPHAGGVQIESIARNVFVDKDQEVLVLETPNECTYGIWRAPAVRSGKVIDDEQILWMKTDGAPQLLPHPDDGHTEPGDALAIVLDDAGITRAQLDAALEGIDWYD